MATMRASRLVGPGRIEVQELARPEPADGQVLVRTLRASICGSDLKHVFGQVGPTSFPTRPGYPGHEGIGEVVESRAAGFAAGELVLTVPDGTCSATFADYQAIPSRFLVPLPRDGAPERLLMAQQLGTVIYALERFWPRALDPAECATVIGAGSAGLYFVQLLKRRGFQRVIVSDRDPGRLELARRMGADVVVAAGEASVIDATLDLTAGRGAGLVVEAAGYDLTRAQAVSAVAPGGRLGFFGLPERPGEAPFPFNELFRRRATLEVSVGTQREPGLRSFRRAVDLILAGQVEVDSLLGEPYPIDRLPEAFRDAHAHQAPSLKVSIGFD